MSGSGNEVAVAAEVEVDVTQIRQLALTGKWVEIIRQLGPSLDTTNVNEYSPKVRKLFPLPLPPSSTRYLSGRPSCTYKSLLNSHQLLSLAAYYLLALFRVRNYSRIAEHIEKYSSIASLGDSVEGREAGAGCHRRNTLNIEELPSLSNKQVSLFTFGLFANNVRV